MLFYLYGFSHGSIAICTFFRYRIVHTHYVCVCVCLHVCQLGYFFLLGPVKFRIPGVLLGEERGIENRLEASGIALFLQQAAHATKV